MKQLKLIVFALLLGFVLIGCDSSQQPGSNTTTPAATTESGQAEVWPPEVKEGEIVSLEAADLLRRNFYVVLDGSGSMGESDCSDGRTKHAAAVEAIGRFSQNAPGDANIGLLIFDSKGTSERVPLASGNRGQINQALGQSRPDGGTPLKSAITRGVDALTQQASRQLGYGEYNLVVVTDGAASMGEDPTRIVNLAIDSTPIVIQTIGFCIDENHSLNQPGRTVYTAVDNVDKLNKELQNVLAEAQTFDLADFQQQ